MVDGQLNPPAHLVHALPSGVVAAGNGGMREDDSKVASGCGKRVSQCERVFLGDGIVDYPEETACDLRSFGFESIPLEQL